MTTIALRPATPEDDEFCFRLHKAALGEYVAELWGWEDEAKREYHRRSFTPERWQIVTVDGVDAGVLVVEEEPDEVYLGRIELHPDHQGRGVGGVLLRRGHKIHLRRDP
ncbi:GNAT family N-acetyltransferase [Amycolatopsis sp. 195334CR]|uniref:GNAT family N-acetyltransferase n=1 Tax=Amycolatopsis sp. 195334CR TaxID=2814588 RepID=UPI001A8E38A1|nr:GNAT family N-acetyltransferase [Amycolatopsis sp. 195334CR]MBN6036461.1 GNAT family N-acetyltransferase [Amycolatopsis sp. 195334CR]